MTWKYDQATGKLTHNDAKVCIGYAGCGPGKNNPSAEGQHNVGPIPRGTYLICAPRDTINNGPYVLPLNPDPENNMHGRSGFLIHGDSKSDPGNASEGCIIVPRYVREQIWNSGDRELLVI